MSLKRSAFVYWKPIHPFKVCMPRHAICTWYQKVGRGTREKPRSPRDSTGSTGSGDASSSICLSITSDAVKESRQQQCTVSEMISGHEPRSGGVDQRQRDTGEAAGAGHGDELAGHALGEVALDTGVLAVSAGRARGECLELGVQLLSILAVLEGERCPTTVQASVKTE